MPETGACWSQVALKELMIDDLTYKQGTCVRTQKDDLPKVRGLLPCSPKAGSCCGANMHWRTQVNMYWHIQVNMYWHTQVNIVCVGLARTVYIHRIWPYIWWFPCQKYCIYTVYIWFWLTLRMCASAPGTAIYQRVAPHPCSPKAGSCCGTNMYWHTQVNMYWHTRINIVCVPLHTWNSDLPEGSPTSMQP